MDFEYKHIEDIEKFKENIRRYRENNKDSLKVRIEELKVLLDGINNDEKFDEKYDKFYDEKYGKKAEEIKLELLQVVGEKWDELQKQLNEIEEQEEAERIEAEKKEEQDRKRIESNKEKDERIKQEREEKRNRPLSEYGDDELIELHSWLRQNIDKMVEASKRKKDDTNLEKFYEMEEKKDAVEKVMEERGVTAKEEKELPVFSRAVRKDISARYYSNDSLNNNKKKKDYSSKEWLAEQERLERNIAIFEDELKLEYKKTPEEIDKIAEKLAKCKVQLEYAKKQYEKTKKKELENVKQEEVKQENLQTEEVQPKQEEIIENYIEERNDYTFAQWSDELEELKEELGTIMNQLIENGAEMDLQDYTELVKKQRICSAKYDMAEKKYQEAKEKQLEEIKNELESNNSSYNPLEVIGFDIPKEDKKYNLDFEQKNEDKTINGAKGKPLSGAKYNPLEVVGFNIPKEENDISQENSKKEKVKEEDLEEKYTTIKGNNNNPLEGAKYNPLEVIGFNTLEDRDEDLLEFNLPEDVDVLRERKDEVVNPIEEEKLQQEAKEKLPVPKKNKNIFKRIGAFLLAGAMAVVTAIGWIGGKGHKNKDKVQDLEEIKISDNTTPGEKEEVESSIEYNFEENTATITENKKEDNDKNIVEQDKEEQVANDNKTNSNDFKDSLTVTENQMQQQQEQNKQQEIKTMLENVRLGDVINIGENIVYTENSLGEGDSGEIGVTPWRQPGDYQINGIAKIGSDNNVTFEVGEKNFEKSVKELVGSKKAGEKYSFHIKDTGWVTEEDIVNVLNNQKVENDKTPEIEH